MHTSAAIDVPEEVLLSTQMSAEGIGERAKIENALALYREGRLSSGLAAKWVGESGSLARVRITRVCLRPKLHSVPTSRLIRLSTPPPTSGTTPRAIMPSRSAPDPRRPARENGVAKPIRRPWAHPEKGA